MVGKRVSGDLYVHKSALSSLDTEQKTFVSDALKATKGQKVTWNVVRISNYNVAFLDYQNFDDDPFPALTISARVDLIDNRLSIRDFSGYSNPPILHRKELLVDGSYPRRDEFEGLTKALDELDVFYETNAIGYRNQWEARLKKHGITIDGHRVKKKGPVGDAVVERHKTAMVRYQLSQPTQLLLRYGLLTEATTFFDYGCGRGHDIEILAENGFEAQGWDPHYNPESALVSADVINLGFVLNVIESPSERREALKKSWALAKTMLAVSVMTPGASSLEHTRPYKDGFLTKRGTFQKYFSQEQLKDFIEETIDCEPIAVAPGIFFIFADDIAKQDFLIKRYESARHRVVSLKPRPKPIDRTFKPDRMEKLAPVLQHYAEDILNAGRLLNINEVSHEIISAFKAERVSLKSAEAYCLSELIEQGEIDTVVAERRGDLILYFALEMFSRRKPYRALPVKLQYDIKAFWGSYANAEIEAKQLLFSVGDSAVIHKSADEALDEGLGYLLEDAHLQFHASILKRLPLALRCYVACASVLYGDVETADLIKIHLRSGKLTLLEYENFSEALPSLKRRVKVDMRQQEVRVFTYDGQEKQYLFMKSLYLPDDWPEYTEQSRFDLQVSKIGKFDFSGYGPNGNVFDEYLKEQNMFVDGFELKALAAR